MHNQKVSKLGSGISHMLKSDCDGVYNWPRKRLRGQRYILGKNWPKYPPLPGSGFISNQDPHSFSNLASKSWTWLALSISTRQSQRQTGKKFSSSDTIWYYCLSLWFHRSSNENDFSMSSYMSSSCRIPSIYDENDQIHTIYGQTIPIFHAWSWLETGLRFQ